MKHTLIATFLLGLWYGIAAVGAPADPKAETELPIGAAGPATESSQTTRAAEALADTDAEGQSAAGSVEVAADADKVNYSLGYELGQDLARDSLGLVPEALIKGAQDGMSGAKPEVKTSERRAVLAGIKEKRAQENLARAQAFLAANAEKEGVKSLPSGLQYKELRAGEGKSPSPASKVSVNYRGTLTDGTEFDGSYARGKPATFEVRKVIKGWGEALQLMKEGAKWELYIPPDLAYGKAGRDKRIPPNSVLIFEVELLAVDMAPAQPPSGVRKPRRDDDE